jgi:glyoxylase-like metal-dependent hydrolase (beta-lactamase superfamily II)
MTHVFTESYRVGDATITKIEEKLSFREPGMLLPGLDEKVIDRLRFGSGSCLPPEHKLIGTSIHSWLVKTPDHTILIDTATGNGKERPFAPQLHQLNEPFLERLARAGAEPEQIDFVILTHLHADHVGWNTRSVDGRWVPTFPNAKYLFSGTENAFFADSAQNDPKRKNRLVVYTDSIVPILESGQAEFIDAGVERLEAIRFLATPGHSLAHLSISLRSKGEEAVFAGDVMHHPIQVYLPSQNSVFCEFPEQAKTSRLRMLDYTSERGAIYFSSHFTESSAGLVTRDGKGFTWRFI